MLLLTGKYHKDRIIAGTNTLVGESNGKLMNIHLYYTEHSQNTMFHVVMWWLHFLVAATTFSTYTNESEIVWIRLQKVIFVEWAFYYLF